MQYPWQQPAHCLKLRLSYPAEGLVHCRGGEPLLAELGPILDRGDPKHALHNSHLQFEVWEGEGIGGSRGQRGAREEGRPRALTSRAQDGVTDFPSVGKNSYSGACSGVAVSALHDGLDLWLGIQQLLMLHSTHFQEGIGTSGRLQ